MKKFQNIFSNNLVETSTKFETTRKHAPHPSTHAPHSPTHAPHSPTHASHVSTVAPHILTDHPITHTVPSKTGPAETTQSDHIPNITTRPVETTKTLTGSQISTAVETQNTPQHDEISTKGSVTHFTHQYNKPTHGSHKETTTSETTLVPERTTTPETLTQSPGIHLTHPAQTTFEQHSTKKPFVTSGFELTSNNLTPNPTKESTHPLSPTAMHGKNDKT